MDEVMEMNGNEYQDLGIEDKPKETENEARIRIAKEIIRKKRKAMAKRRAELGESEGEEGEELDLMNTVNAKIDFVGKSRHESLGHVFKGKVVIRALNGSGDLGNAEDLGAAVVEKTEELKLSEETATDKKSEVQDNAIEQELQRDLLETQNRVFYPIYTSIKAEFESNSNGFEEISVKAHKRPITACKFDPLSQDLISVGKDGAILRHFFKEGYKSKILVSAGFPKDPNGHKDEILACDISYDGKFLITAGKDRVIRLWTLKANKFLYEFKGHRGSINAVKFKDNSHDFVSLAEDRALKLWDAERRGFLETFYGHSSQPISLDRLGTKFFVSGGYDSAPIVWKIEQEKIMKFLKQPFSIGKLLNVLCNLGLWGWERILVLGNAERNIWGLYSVWAVWGSIWSRYQYEFRNVDFHIRLYACCLLCPYKLYTTSWPIHYILN